jgi:hypothetical protein
MFEVKDFSAFENMVTGVRWYYRRVGRFMNGRGAAFEHVVVVEVATREGEG